MTYISNELWHLPPMRGAGPTGTKYEHIKPSVQVPSSSPLLARVLAMLPSGLAPEGAIRVHRSAKLSAPYKREPDGGLSADIRPLSCGSAHWMAAMRGWSEMFKEEAVAACGDAQYGVGTPGACVKLRHDLLLESKVVLRTWLCLPPHFHRK